MSEAPTSEQLAAREAHYDRFHESGDVQGIVKRLRAEAWGDEFPEEVDPSSSCTWSVLGEMVGRLGLAPGELLVDLGSGRGGTGLWLARAFNARLIGVDISPRAAEIAERRAGEFLPASRASVRTCAAAEFRFVFAHFGSLPSRSALSTAIKLKSRGHGPGSARTIRLIARAAAGLLSPRRERRWSQLAQLVAASSAFSSPPAVSASHVHRFRRPDRADAGDHPHRAARCARRDPLRLPAHPGHRGPGRSAGS